MTEGESQLLAVRLEASLAKFEKQLSRAYGVAKKMSTGMEQRFSDMERKTQKSASASANAIQRELDKRRKGYENLMASMDPVFAATLRFQQGEKKLADALKYGEITTKEHARAMKLLKGQYDAVKASATQTGTAIARTGRVSRQGRFMIQNSANQVADMFVQFEMGTDPMRIMGQQMPQLLAGFGAFGAVAGTVSAILFPIAGMLLNIGKEADDAEDEVKDFADAMDVASMAISDVGEAADLVTDLEQLQRMYGALTEEVIDLTRALARLKEEEAIGATSTAVQKFFDENPFLDSLRQAMSGRDEIAAEIQREISAAESQIEAGINVQYNREFVEQLKADLAALGALQDVEIDFGVDADQAQRIVDLFQQLNAGAESGDIRAILAAVDELRESLQGLDNADASKLADGLAPVESMVRQAVAQFDRLEGALEETGDTAGVAGLRFSELVEKYARDTARLKELAADRDAALAMRDSARANGNDQALADAEAVIAAIDEEIARIGDHETRIRELNEQAREMRELLAHIPADEGGETRAAIETLLGLITDATEEGAKLDGVRLDNLEGQFDIVLGAVDRLLQKLGLARDMFTEFKVPDEWRSVFGTLAGSSDGQTASAALLRRFEGFRSTPYWDVNALRAGYGSDTVTLSDGSVRRVTQGMTVSVEDANRDLARRIVEFQRGIIDEIGMARWNQFNPAQQAALTSVAYNYGSIGAEGAGISSVVRSGSSDEIANAIRALAGHNGGINRDRRLTEAQVFSNGVGVEEAALRQERELAEARRAAAAEERRADDERQRALEREIEQRERALELRQGLVEAAQQQLSDAEFEATLIGKSASEQARLRAEYMLTQDAKRRGIDLNERLAGQEKTYAELIREQADAIGRVVAAKEEQEAQNERLAQQEQQLADLGQSIKDSLLDAIIAGEDFADVLANVAKMLARAALEAALFGSGPFGGGGGGLLGGIFSSIFGLKDGGPVQRLASGGYVTGPGGPRADLVPAMLSNGEYVMNAEATKKHRPLLDALNFGMAQKYASGGLVGGGAPSVTMGSSGDINLSVEVHTQSDQPQEVAGETAEAVRGVMISIFNQQLGQSMRPGGVIDTRYQRKAGV
jgi:GH24 family phage-related lysozyme (muramidase)/predicted DNA-binding WGR domain protein